MQPSAISSVTLREFMCSTNPELRFLLREAGFISILSTAAGIRTKRDPSFPRLTTPWRSPKNLRRTTAGMEPRSSLPMTGDKKLPEWRSFGRVTWQTGKFSFAQSKYATCVFQIHSSSWRSCHDDRICQFGARHPYDEIALGRGDTFAWPGDMVHGRRPPTSKG